MFFVLFFHLLIVTSEQVWSVKGLQDTLLWLNDWPGGLKLNYELGSFFCDAFLWFTAVWEGSEYRIPKMGRM